MSSAVSPGPSISEAEPILIFDLDGTILGINSFPQWVRYMLHGSFHGLGAAGRGMLSMGTMRIMLARKLLKLGHAPTKQRLQKLWAEALIKDKTSFAAQNFARQLLLHVRPEFRDVLAEVANGKRDGILATAAAGEYANAVAAALGFTHVITTTCHGEKDWVDNCRENKRDRVLAYLAKLGWDRRSRIFFTDHEEDLAFMQVSQHVAWFGKAEDVPAMERHAPGVHIIAATGKSPEALLDWVRSR